VRVGLLCGRHLPDQDGVADYTARLAAALMTYGVEPVLVGGAGGNGTVVAQRWDLRGTVRAARQLRRLDLDVLHVQWAPSAYGFRGAVGLLPLLLRGTPVVTTLHEYGWWAWPPQVPDRLWRLLEQRGWADREGLLLTTRSRAVVATNEAHVRAQRSGRLPVVVPLVANVEVSAPVTARTPGLLVFFGFVHPVKGVRYLLEALAELRRQGRDLTLVVAGGFTSLALPQEQARAFRAELEQLAEGLPVRFTGHLAAAEVSALLRAADLVVLPLTAGVTTRNGALLAAFAHGAPVVATAPDEPDPALVDGANVLLLPERRDGAALARAVARALDDPHLREQVAAGGERLAAGRSWDAVAQRHLELYP
jgi:glycosyltransferase involved in cell wall biosynthesis